MAALETMCAKENVELFIPPLSLCTDNAAMIAAAAVASSRDPIPYPDYLPLDAFAEKVR